MGYWKRVTESITYHARRRAWSLRHPVELKAWEVCSYCHDSMYTAPFIFDSYHEDIHMSILDNVFKSVPRDKGDQQATDDTISTGCPILFAMLTSTPKVDGKRRTVATLTLVAEDGVWKAGLRDRDHAVSLWVSGETMSDALKSLEKALALPYVPWRKTPDNYSRNRK